MKEFSAELELIANPKVRAFVQDILDQAPDYFWKIPSSSTGKHHPPDENVDGGLVIHVKRATRVANDLCRNFDVTGDERDFVLGAVITHDICKNGYPGNTGYTTSGHGSLWIQVVNKIRSSDEILSSKMITTIGRLVATHMGKWDIPYTTYNNRLDLIVQISDYVSSRDYIIVDYTSITKDSINIKPADC